MAYSVKEIFYTLQGEGANAGRAAVFCRFSGCNLWSGREQDRANAICQFCDTNFVGVDGALGGKYSTAADLSEAIASVWPNNRSGSRFVVLTGGEPLLQVDPELIDCLHNHGFWIAVETNGTISPPVGLDWITVSPKANSRLVVTEGDEIKVVWPQTGINLAELQALAFKHRYIQPLDDSARTQNAKACVEVCLHEPSWRLSLQTHKLLGIP